LRYTHVDRTLSMVQNLSKYSKVADTSTRFDTVPRDMLLSIEYSQRSTKNTSAPKPPIRAHKPQPPETSTTIGRNDLSGLPSNQTIQYRRKEHTIQSIDRIIPMHSISSTRKTISDVKKTTTLTLRRVSCRNPCRRSTTLFELVYRTADAK
jgi:hypothetical protein